MTLTFVFVTNTCAYLTFCPPAVLNIQPPRASNTETWQVSLSGSHPRKMVPKFRLAVLYTLYIFKTFSGACIIVSDIFVLSRWKSLVQRLPRTVAPDGLLRNVAETGLREAWIQSQVFSSALGSRSLLELFVKGVSLPNHSCFLGCGGVCVELWPCCEPCAVK